MSSTCSTAHYDNQLMANSLVAEMPGFAPKAMCAFTHRLRGTDQLLADHYGRSDRETLRPNSKAHCACAGRMQWQVPPAFGLGRQFAFNTSSSRQVQRRKVVADNSLPVWMLSYSEVAKLDDNNRLETRSKSSHAVAQLTDS
jgi:hypothetical protein